ELNELTRIDLRDVEALHALASLEERAGRWDMASSLYRRLASLEDGPALVATALRLAAVCERLERLGDARSALERARSVAPDDAEVRARLRAVYNVLGAARELAAMILEDAAHAPDAATRFSRLVHAGRL